MKTFVTILCFPFYLFFTAGAAKAQEKRYQFTVSAGTGITFGLDNLKKPGYTVQLHAEKFFNDDDTKTYWLTLGYLQQSPQPSITEPDAPGSIVTKTTHFHKVTVKTLTFGARKFFENGFLLGGGIGAGAFEQVYPTKTYSDGSRYYDQYEHSIGDLGIGHIAQVGFKRSNVQILFTGNSIWLPFRTTVDVDYERATPVYFPTLALSIGYTF